MNSILIWNISFTQAFYLLYLWWDHDSFYLFQHFKILLLQDRVNPMNECIDVLAFFYNQFHCYFYMHKIQLLIWVQTSVWLMTESDCKHLPPRIWCFELEYSKKTVFCLWIESKYLDLNKKFKILLKNDQKYDKQLWYYPL